MTISPERERYHLHLATLAASLPDGAVLVDIGKSQHHDYGETFARQKMLTLDCNPMLSPDIAMNLEDGPGDYAGVADAILCNGVTEQCQNPFALVAGARQLLKPGGTALFGIMSVGYPIYGTDFTRFTPDGARRLLRLGKLSDLSSDIVKRAGVPSYVFITARPEQ